MAYIQKVKRKQDTAYRVFILVDKEKRITKTFSTKRSAVQFVNSVESDRNKLLAYTQSKSRTLLSLVIDKYLNYEYKGIRVNDERVKLNFWIKALGDKPGFSFLAFFISWIIFHTLFKKFSTFMYLIIFGIPIVCFLIWLFFFAD